MNNTLNNDLNTAFNLYENYYSNEDLISFLKNGTIVEKQISALKLNKISNKDEAKILIDNLTGCDGKIREAVSFRLKDFIAESPEFYINFHDIFLDAIIDINGNICRNTINAIKNLKNFPEFTSLFCKKLSKHTLELAKKVKTFDIQEGKYKINKEVFKLYWYLEAIYEFEEFIETETLKGILTETKEINDYTIREKTAKILSKKIIDEDLLRIRQELKNDANYYVRRY